MGASRTKSKKHLVCFIVYMVDKRSSTDNFIDIINRMQFHVLQPRQMQIATEYYTVNEAYVITHVIEDQFY